MSDIRILIVDDHSLFRESLGRLLESAPDFHLAGQCATVAEAVAACSQTQPDVILLDYDLGEEQGSALLAELARHHIQTRVLMVTAGMPDAATLRIMEAGASGVFLKHSSLDQLLTAIHQVAKGEVWMDSAAVRSLVAGRGTKAEQVERACPLSPRQGEVLRAIFDGLRNKEIAWKLKTSESAVKAVIQELFHKAGVRTRSQLVRIAIEKHSAGWLGLGS
jgi:two-component system nitrate/nitrite response regulator NarL